MNNIWKDLGLEVGKIIADALKGGPTSGNYGHGGRPGERGGSTGGGGHGKLGIEKGASREDARAAVDKHREARAQGKKPAEREIVKRWKTQSGKEVTVTGKLITSKEVANEYNIIETQPALEIQVTANVEGVGKFDGNVSVLPQPHGEYTHYMSRSGNNDKLALTTEQANTIKEIINTFKQDPLWQKREALINRNLRDAEEYQRTMARLFPEDYRRR